MQSFIIIVFIEFKLSTKDYSTNSAKNPLKNQQKRHFFAIFAKNLEKLPKITIIFANSAKNALLSKINIL